MNHRHRKVLHALFAHPVSGNINMKAVEAVLEELGGEISWGHGGRLHVTLNGHTAVFASQKHDLPLQEAMQVKKFLVDCGIDPATQYPL